MVRHKSRWLLVNLDFQEHVKSKNKTNATDFPSKKEISFYIRQNISSCFGIAANGAASDTQIRFCDPATRLILLRVPREFCGMVRSSMSLLTHLGASEGPPTVIASIISVNGSARTAKIAAISQVRKLYRLKLKGLEGEELQQVFGSLEETLGSIENIN